MSVILQADNVVLCVLESQPGGNGGAPSSPPNPPPHDQSARDGLYFLHRLSYSSKVTARLYFHFVLVYLQICCARVTG